MARSAPCSAVRGDRPAPRRSDRLLALGTVDAAALFAAGVRRIPHSPGESLFYDLFAYNVVSLGAAALCRRAAGRVRAERVAWRAISAGWAFSVVGNLL